MKRFLKKANRGLILGAIILVVLVIYLIVDYSNFDDEKSQIKTTLENYITGYCDLMEQNDYEALENYVNEAWTSTQVMTSDLYWYLNKQTAKDVFVEVSKSDHVSEYGDVVPVISKISIKKSGPNTAYATVEYNIKAEYVGYAEPLHPFSEYYSNWYIHEEETYGETRYMHVSGFETQVYLVKEDDQWKISQSQSWNMDSYMTEMEEE